MTNEECAKMRKDLGLRPECAKCGHDRWTYLKSVWAWACQRHGWL